MKKRSLVLCVVSIIIALIALLGFAACDDKEHRSDGESNGRGLTFDSGLSPNGLIDLIRDGTIKNYTLKAIETENENEMVTSTFYVADGLYYMYYTISSDSSYFGGYIIDENYAYEIFPDSTAYTIRKYKFGSESYNGLKRILTFNRENGVSNILSHYLYEDGVEIKNFKADNDRISWSVESISNPEDEFGITEYVTLYNVNSTEICEFPEECKNYKELAVEV